MKLKKRKSTWDIGVTDIAPESASDGRGKVKVPVTEIHADGSKDFLDEYGDLENESDPKELAEKLHVDFEELGIEPPYVEEFYSEFGVFPVLSIQSYCKLPLRYKDRAGNKKFRMHSLEAGRELKAKGSEPGKRVPFNFLCEHRDGEFVLEPKMITKFCKVLNPYHPSFGEKALKSKDKTMPEDGSKKSKSRKTKAHLTDTKKLKTLMEKRKKEAKFAL